MEIESPVGISVINITLFSCGKVRLTAIFGYQQKMDIVHMENTCLGMHVINTLVVADSSKAAEMEGFHSNSAFHVAN